VAVHRTIVALAVIVVLTTAPRVPDRDGAAVGDERASAIARGARLFATEFLPQRGLGPLFNQPSCLGCHNTPSPGGTGPDGLGTVTRVGRLTPVGFDPMHGRGGPIARARSVSDPVYSCDLAPGIPAGANVTSVRNAPSLYGVGLIDAIPDEVIAAGVILRGGVLGRPHRIRSADGQERIGRFGWKAETVTLRQFVAEAFRNELGITNPLAPVDLMGRSEPGRRCVGESEGLEDDGRLVDAVTAFLAALPAPAAPIAIVARPGSVREDRLRRLPYAEPAAGQSRRAALFRPPAARPRPGSGRESRSRPGERPGLAYDALWGLGRRSRLLHDGRARSIGEAIRAHGGEAAPATRDFHRLSPKDRDELLAFLADL
jgi:CxxC motif-containing protein (DUF1111 family)